MRNAVRFVLLCLLLLSTASELRASIPQTRVREFFSLVANPQPEESLQVPELRLDNPLLYGELVSGQQVWTKFDPEGLNSTWGGDNWFANWLLPDPKGETSQSSGGASKMFDSNLSTSDRVSGGLNFFWHGIMAVALMVPGEGALEKIVEKGAVEVAEKVVETGAEDVAENSAKKTTEKTAEAVKDVEKGAVYDVGTANDLRKTPVVGTEVHHAPGNASASTLVGDQNPANSFGNEPAIRLPESEHGAVTAAHNALPAQASARDLLANEAKILKNKTEVPNSKIQELIKLNKDQHPYDYQKLDQ